MNLIRDLLKEPAPPSHAATAEALHRLEREQAGPQPRSRRVPPRRNRLIWSGLLGAATVAAVTVAAVGLPADSAGPGREEPRGALSARQVLLAAAESAARAPSTGTGAYWFTHFRTGGATVVTGRAGRSLVYQCSETKDWNDARSPTRTDAETKAGRGGTTMHYAGTRDLGTCPLGAVDTVAGKRDGSPSAGSAPNRGRAPARTGTAPGPWEIHKERTAFNSAFGDGSLAQLRALPTDPARLRAHFLSTPQRSQGGRQDHQSPDQWVFDAAGYLLTDEPVAPQVRVAAYRMLAALPGVRAAGNVPDPLGRMGAAVELPGVSGPGLRDRIIVEPSSGRLLARETFTVAPVNGYPAGTMLNWQALVDARWTNRAPSHATELPG
ncbi:CU044_5270 family protein [Actinomadura parmotrematis]|nr:CU044_5270 family protein [Actinomadura parmotrematis]